MVATHDMVVDGRTYKKGQEIWDLGSFDCIGVEAAEWNHRRHYLGKSADIAKLPKYVPSGSTATCVDTGEEYMFLQTGVENGEWSLQPRYGTPGATGAAGKDGKDGSKFYAVAKDLEGGTSVEADAPSAVEGDIVVDSNGDLFTVDASKKVQDSGINLKGEEGPAGKEGTTGPKGDAGKGVSGISLTTDDSGKVTSGMVTFDDGSSAEIKITPPLGRNAVTLPVGEIELGDSYGKTSDYVGDTLNISWTGVDGKVVGEIKYKENAPGFETTEGSQSGNYFPLILDKSYASSGVTIVTDKEKTENDSTWLICLNNIMKSTKKITAKMKDGTIICTLDFSGATLGQKAG